MFYVLVQILYGSSIALRCVQKLRRYGCACSSWLTSMRVCVCVCVNHLNRCKTSIFCWLLRFIVSVHYFKQRYHFSALFQAGGRGIQSGTTSNEATWLYGIQSLISQTYLQFSYSDDGNRLSQEPACRFIWFSSTVTAICNLLSLLGLHILSELRFDLVHSGI